MNSDMPSIWLVTEFDSVAVLILSAWPTEDAAWSEMKRLESMLLLTDEAVLARYPNLWPELSRAEIDARKSSRAEPYEIIEMTMCEHRSSGWNP